VRSLVAAGSYSDRSGTPESSWRAPSRISSASCIVCPVSLPLLVTAAPWPATPIRCRLTPSSRRKNQKPGLTSRSRRENQKPGLTPRSRRLDPAKPPWLTLRQETRERRIIPNVKPLIETPRVTSPVRQSRASRREASLAWGRVTVTAKRSEIKRCFDHAGVSAATITLRYPIGGGRRPSIPISSDRRKPFASDWPLRPSTIALPLGRRAPRVLGHHRSGYARHAADSRSSFSSGHQQAPTP
jgi:hypothetical protein